MEYINYKRATPVKGANFNYRREDYYIKKVEDGIVYTTNGKMFSQKALQTSGIIFNQFKAKSNSPRRVRGQRRENMEDELTELKYELKGYKSDLRNLFQEMDYEAGQKGKDWSDADANRYGGEMNEVEEKIEKLENQIRMREEKLSYNNGGFMDSVYKRGGMLTPSQRYILEIKGLTGLTQKAIEDYISENNLNNDDVLNIVIGLGRKQIDGKNVATAMIGKKDNVESKKLLAFAKSKKALSYADGGFMNNVYKRGGALKGNQSKIDMNKNGKLDAEDFKILRSSMNGAWRNERQHVNSTSRKNGKVIDYEVKYARKNNTSRTGYKGKSKFDTGGLVNTYLEQLASDERQEGKKAKIYEANFDGKTIEAQTTQKTFPDGVPVMKTFSKYKSVTIKGKHKIVESENWWYFKIDNTWYAVNRKKYGTPPFDYENGGEHITFARKSKAIAKKFEGKQVEPKYQRTYGKRYDKEEAKEVGNKIAGKMKTTYDKKAFGGFFKKALTKPESINLDDKQVRLKTGEYVQVLDQSGDSLMVMDLNKLGTGVQPKRVNISEVDMSSFMSGGKVEKKTTKTTKNQTSDKRGGAMQLAKKTRKPGESWHDALRRATAEIKKTKSNN